jgi:hypothetical protein
MAARAAFKLGLNPAFAPCLPPDALSHSATAAILQYRVGSVSKSTIRQGEALFLTGFTILL